MASGTFKFSVEATQSSSGGSSGSGGSSVSYATLTATSSGNSAAQSISFSGCSAVTTSNIASICMFSRIASSWSATYVISWYYNKDGSIDQVVNWTSSSRYSSGESDIEFYKSGSSLIVRSSSCKFNGTYDIYITYLA